MTADQERYARQARDTRTPHISNVEHADRVLASWRLGEEQLARLVHHAKTSPVGTVEERHYLVLIALNAQQAYGRDELVHLLSVAVAQLCERDPRLKPKLSAARLAGT